MAQLKNLIVTGPSSFGQDVHCLGNGKAFKVGNANYSVGLHMGSGGSNRGLYDFYKKEWMIYSNSNNEVYMNGTAAMADEATKVLHNLETTKKFYLSGTTLTASGQSTPCFDTGIYTDTTAGHLVVTGGIQSKADNDFIASGNEFNFIPSGYKDTVYINYKTATGEKNGALTNYVFLNGAGNTGTAGYASITAKNATFSGDLAVSGATTVSGATVLNGNTTIGNEATDTLTVKAAPTFSNGLIVSSGGASITGNTSINSGTLTVAKKLTVSTEGITVTKGGLTVSDGGASIKGVTSINGNTSITGTFSVSSTSTFTGAITATGGVTGNVTGNLTGTADKAKADENGKNIASTYMPFTGGKFTGPISFKDGSALPEWDNASGNLQYILGISAFASGGQMYWEYANQVSVGHATNADSAEKALADNDGNTFGSYYCTLSTEQSITAKKTFTQPIGITAAANMQYNETDQCIEIVFN